MLYQVASENKTMFASRIKSDRRLRRSRRALNSAIEFTVQELERRVLMSAAPITGISKGQLNIYGTAGDDTIVVQMDPTVNNQIDVTINGFTQYFSSTGLKRINITGYDGDDSISLVGALPVPAGVTDGNGSDTLSSSSSGHDSLTAGNGNDTLISNGAFDVLKAGNGNDSLTASWLGHDSLTAGNGQDTLTGSLGGYDKLVAGNGADLIQALPGSRGNWLQGGSGNDTLNGGSGDTYHYGSGENMVSHDYGTTTTVLTTTKHAALPNVASAGSVAASFMLAAPTGVDGISGLSSEVGFNNIDTLEAAYSIPDPTQAGNPTGAGQTIAIIDAAGPTAAQLTSDLTFFSENVPQGDLDTSGADLLDQSGVALLGMPNSFGSGNVTTLPTPTTSNTPGANQFTFQVVLATPNGQQPVVPESVSGLYATETCLDIEWAHAIAPKAKIIVFQALPGVVNFENPEGLYIPSLMFAVNQAAQYLSKNGGGVVSMSFGGGEFVGQFQYDNAIFGNSAYRNVSFVASAGDAAGEDSYPAMSPYVTSVGGTTLQKTYFQQPGAPGNGVAATPWLEYPWSESNGEGTGAGVSELEPIPTYQVATNLDAEPNTELFGTPTGATQPVTIASLGARSGPDVVMEGDPNTGVAVYDTLPDPSFGNVPGWQEVGGTSLSAPMFAAVVALANQGRATNHLPVLGVDLNPAIYQLNNTEYELPSAQIAPTSIMTLYMGTLTPTPIIGNFQPRGEATGTATYLKVVSTPNQPTPLDPDLVGVTGLFYDIGGAIAGTEDPVSRSEGGTRGSVNQGTVGTAPVLNTDPGWDEASGWGSPNVNVLVDATIPRAYAGNVITHEVSDGGTFQDYSGAPPTQNLANIVVSYNVAPQPVYGLSVNVPTLKVSFVNYLNHNNPAATGTGTINEDVVAYNSAYNIEDGAYNGTGFTPPNAISIGPDLFTLNLVASLAPNDPLFTETTQTLQVSASAIFNPATGVFGFESPGAGGFAGQLFWIQGQITDHGKGISGSFYSISGLDSAGKPIPLGKDGVTANGKNDVIGEFES